MLLRLVFPLAALMLLLPVTNAWSQTTPSTYPAKLVRLIVPVAPGGNQDMIARAMAEHLTRALGQSVVVESRPGASAIVGTRFVKSAAPDGYTLLTISNTFVRTPALQADAGYDPLADFVAVSMTGDVPLVLVVNPSLPVKTVQEFIALAKRRPGEITSGSSGVGSTGHVATEAFSRRAGIRMLHVQYKGAAPAVVDLVGGHLMSRFDQVSTSLAHIRSGKIRALAVTTRKRSPALPEVPTIAESGFPGFHDSTFNGLMAPAGTPREIVDRLHAEISKAVAGPARNRFLENGVELIASPSPADFAAFLKREVTQFAVLAKQANMKAD